MSSYDVLIGVHEKRLNSILEQIYNSGQLRKSLFTGSTSGTQSDITYQVNWSFGAVPVFALRPPTNKEWDTSIKADKAPDALPAGAFVVSMPSLSLTVTVNGHKLQLPAPEKAICTLAISDGAITFSALSVIANINRLSDIDKDLVTNDLVPEVLSKVTEAISGIALPVINIPGISLTSPVVRITDKYVLASFNHVQPGSPSLESVKVPGDPFFVLLSPGMVQSIADQEVGKIKTFDKSDGVSGGGFSAKYTVHGKIQKISLLSCSDPMMLHADVSLNISASAGINIPVETAIEKATKPFDPKVFHPHGR